MTPQERADAIDEEPKMHALAALGPLVRNRDLGRTSKIVIMLKLADEVGEAVAPHAICQKGCSHCCKMAVPLADLEAKLIAEAIGRERRPVARFVPEHMIEREQNEQVEKWKGVACSFLGDDGVCTIYEHRPLACRTHFSLSETPDDCDMVEHPGRLVPKPNLNAFAMACAHILRGTRYADIREFFPKEP